MVEVNEEFPEVDQLVQEEYATKDSLDNDTRDTWSNNLITHQETEQVRDLTVFDRMQEKDFSSMEFDEAMEMLEEVKKTMDEKSPMPKVEKKSISLLAKSPLVPHGGHWVEWKALIIQSWDQQILRYQDFETINGPNLRVYLATDTNATDFVDLGKLKGTKWNINYLIPAWTDLTKYNHALVWCVPFRVLFNSAKFDL